MAHSPGLESPTAALLRPHPQAPTALLTSTSTQALRFGVRIGAFGLLIAPNRQAEVLAKPTLYALPHSPVWLAGLMPLRGHLLPVVDLYPLLELDVENPSRFLLVLGQREQSIAILIDALPRTLALPAPLTQLPPLPAALAPHISRAYETPAGLWFDWQDQTFLQQLASASSGRV
jgi:chemotaxis signal transduction protein